MIREHRIPEMGQGTFQKFNFDIDKMSDAEKECVRLDLKAKMMTEEQRLAPDTFCCECFFLQEFVNYEMERDFPLIAKEFLQHEMKHLSDYTKLSFVSTDPVESWPEAAYCNMILNLMMNAVHAESEYARQLFCNLYRTYYKREYNVLKRFHHISATEIVDIAENERHQATYFDIARLLCISKMFGISVDQDCSFLYLMLDERWEEFFSHDADFYCFADGALQEAREEINVLFRDGEDMMNLLEHDKTFSRKVLQYFECDEDYVDFCDDENYGVEDTLAKTLAFLKDCFPKRNFSKEEILAYAQVYHSISALQCASTQMADLLKATFGLPDCGDYEDTVPLFKPDQIILNRSISRKISDPGDRKENKAVKNASSLHTDNETSNNLLTKEIEELREKLHMQEKLNLALQKQLRENNRRLAEQEENSKQFKEERKELVALREHLYHLTEETEQILDVSAEEMAQAISVRDIMIVGGNDNWVKKLRAMFPNWRFISPNASAAVSSMQTAKMEKAYFFTDTLGHSQYYKYIQVIRTRQIPFGYIHGVNIQANIRQIYRDLVSA